MAYVTVGQENSEPIKLFYEDHGAGRPVVLIHGFPLNGRSWEKQERVLLSQGLRVITYDRRGFGQSSQPSSGYDYDTFAADLNALLTRLNVYDVSLVGFSMGTGEVVRYLSTYGQDRVLDAALLGPIPPFLLRTDDNPEGVDGNVFEGLRKAILADRYAFLRMFLDDFYNADKLHGTRISDDAWRASFNVGAIASAKATYDCVNTWLTDFRDDLRTLDVPLLVMQGSEDRILPFDATGKRLRSLIKGDVVVVEGGPHAIIWTHADEVNRELLRFLGQTGHEARGAKPSGIQPPATVH